MTLIRADDTQAAGGMTLRDACKWPDCNGWINVTVQMPHHKPFDAVHEECTGKMKYIGIQSHQISGGPMIWYVGANGEGVRSIQPKLSLERFSFPGKMSFA